MILTARAIRKSFIKLSLQIRKGIEALGFVSRRGVYVAVIVVALAGAVLVYNNFLAKPSLELNRIVWRRSGGFAGLEETLTIGLDGSVSLTSSFLGDAEFTISDSEWEELVALIGDSGFMGLDDSYGAKAGVADFFSYSLTVEADSSSKRVQWVDDWAAEGTLPEGLGEIGEGILEIIQGTGTGGVEGIVSDEAGSPMEGLVVSIVRGSVGYPEIAAITGEDGSYSIGSVPPGVFSLGVHDDTGEKLAEETVFVRGEETSRLDFVVGRGILYDQSGGVGLFMEGIHVVATDGDPTAPEALEGYSVWNEYWEMLKEGSTLNASSDDFISVLLARGDQSTGGFAIGVESWARQGGYHEVLRFDVNLTDPGEGVPVTEAFTNPIALIPVGRLDPGLYIVRVYVDRFIMTFDGSGNPVYDPVETLVEEIWELGFEVS